MIKYYDKLKTFFTKTKNEARLKELESVKDDQVALIKLYNRFKSNLPVSVNELKQIIKEQILNEIKDKVPGGLAKGKTIEDIAKEHESRGPYNKVLSYVKQQLQKGIKVEMEHTTDLGIAEEIAMDHLWEDPKYYEKLTTIERD